MLNECCKINREPDEDWALHVGFYLAIRDGGEYSAESKVADYPEVGDSQIVTLGMQFNSFLRQAGYFRKNDYLFMTDVTEEEMWYLDACLADYRMKKEEKEVEEE